MTPAALLHKCVFLLFPFVQAGQSQDDSEIGSQLHVMEASVYTTERRYNELKIAADRKVRTANVTNYHLNNIRRVCN